MRHGVLRDPGDRAIGTDEEHVERHVSVLHPHGDRSLCAEVEQHPPALRQLASKHQALAALLRGVGELHFEHVNAGTRHDFHSLQGLRMGDGAGEQQEGKKNGYDRSTDARAN
jgi:hypothetical protein